MLYKLGKTGKRFTSIDPLAFSHMPLEKDLENLLAQNLWDVLFESSRLMPLFQERAWQPEADIYALNESGDLVVFELKRAKAKDTTAIQALRYCEKASQLDYDKLEKMLRKYRDDPSLSLQETHQAECGLERQLDRSAFNRQQHIMIVGSATDDKLVRNIDYWKSRGLSIDFVPYRLYRIGREDYFEFFSLPYDQHSNPADRKGVIFDTNRSYKQDAIWYMTQKNRVAAFGPIKGIVHSLNKKDLVFLYHKGFGVIAAGEVASDVFEDPSWDGNYCAVKWQTPVPIEGEPIKALSPSQIQHAVGRNFWWAKTMKVPYLDEKESGKLLRKLKALLK
jgi:hypothetical protein